MKIKSYKLFQVPPRWLFLKIETDEGITGWGKPVLEGKASTVKTAVDEMMEYLIGKDPMPVEDHWNVLYRSAFYRGGPVLMSAISGIDQDEDVVKKMSETGHNWKNPLWRHEDGSVAEW